ncbi:hypothetical protein XA68_16854 [Ophiocordyceps unilateralis]|uniref:Uncharacterized protein n=1 Tax=Ophiocordyceps unilateralis TaxID=268505 RepID=A0A2A9P5T3_OPHUN|nr:hypothetical protein XA68_16854 [Ophiocordyceps unilateralis]
MRPRCPSSSARHRADDDDKDVIPRIVPQQHARLSSSACFGLSFDSDTDGHDDVGGGDDDDDDDDDDNDNDDQDMSDVDALTSTDPLPEHDYFIPVVDLRDFFPEVGNGDGDDDENDNNVALDDPFDPYQHPVDGIVLTSSHFFSFTPSLTMNDGAPWPLAPGLVTEQPTVPDNFPPVQLSNPNPTILGSSNLGLVDFLRVWALNGCFPSASRSRPPHLLEVYAQARAQVDDVTYADLCGDQCDLQGLDWATMETTREDARTRRRLTYNNYVNRAGSDMSRGEDDTVRPTDSFFRFKRMNFRSDMSLAHFQLRSVLACPTRMQAYYTSPSGISRLDLSSRKADVAMNLRDYFPTMGAVFSTLAAGHGVLMGGTFNGDYYIQPLDSDGGKAFTEGQISPDGITNHMRIHTPRRSSRPVASIASNDCGFRVLDIESDSFVSHVSYDFALNCSALSPDRRLRVLVGDDPKVLIVNADTGETLQELTGHRDYGFACDWSDDGWTVATGFQDKAVKIWDARRWCDSSGASTPLCTIRSEMAGVRGLRFSPLGGGRPVLVAAEEADFVNLIDAQTFATKQTIDVFSEIGGIAFANEGQDLNILCCDAHRGGLLQLERCGSAFESESGRGWPRLADGEHHFWKHEAAPYRRPTMMAGPDPF